MIVSMLVTCLNFNSYLNVINTMTEVHSEELELSEFSECLIELILFSNENYK